MSSPEFSFTSKLENFLKVRCVLEGQIGCNTNKTFKLKYVRTTFHFSIIAPFLFLVTHLFPHFLSSFKKWTNKGIHSSITDKDVNFPKSLKSLKQRSILSCKTFMFTNNEQTHCKKAKLKFVEGSYKKILCKLKKNGWVAGNFHGGLVPKQQQQNNQIHFCSSENRQTNLSNLAGSPACSKLLLMQLEVHHLASVSLLPLNDRCPPASD